MMQQPQEDIELAHDSRDFSVFSSSPSLWKMLTTAIQTLSEDCTFEIDADGLRTRAMDPSHVAMLDVKISSSAFQNFRCAKPTKFTIHVEDFARIVKRSEQKDPFEISRVGSRALSIKIGSGSYRREFELHLIDDEVKSSPLPRLSFTTRFSMDLQTFQQILTDISVVSNHITVSVRNGSVVVTAKGDAGKAQISLGKENGSLLEEASVEGSSEETRAVYNLEYLLKTTKAVSSFADFVRFEFSNKMPLRLEFSRAESRSSGGPVHFYLAPKMVD
jgi:proliferating cell nuclear antigen